MESLIASGDFVPPTPIRVGISPANSSHAWTAGNLVEWRWTDEQAGDWEGLVQRNVGSPQWVSGDRLVRVRDQPPGFSQRTS